MNETTETPAVKLRGLTKSFGANQVVQPLDLEIGRNEFFSILGPSGCGKTTLMRMITGFEKPTGGSVELDGKNVDGVPTKSRDLNMLFQSYALFPHLTVYENVAFELRVRRTPKREIDQRVRDALDLVRLGAFGDRKPAELSGGQRQRVALARAVVGRPAVVLLDEPLGALDQKLRKEMQFELKRMQREVGITFIYVTHDQEEALTMSDRIAVMSEGRVLQVASPIEIYDAPSSRFVASFIGSCNLLDGVVDVQGGSVTVPGVGSVPAAMPADARPGTGVTLAIRPERVTMTPAAAVGAASSAVAAAGPGSAPAAAPAGSVAGTLVERVFLGDEWTFHVLLESRGLVTVSVPSGAESAALGAVADGAPVVLSWPAEAARVLPADGSAAFSSPASAPSTSAPTAASAASSTTASVTTPEVSA
ncbi:ABC transporter ATP-binding protein [Herbiconiux sp. KACC 21604]|uniref:ABC transporter ATP-binding protein n=1 Tax=unclassified Herbiconiux TaxID=2618217 RepID=UPI0014917440|nr:ABC transporter ATP-binding protein [Herbiconiux sp. SALV-R1]QJU55342.1 ABC transporter ATP-binding protein [Herbiconiux sp. SALV-R1]WPO86512.1 ABC transporter ATP-binding protein [Herbiconiux sp. KACC 21604]